MARAFAPHYHTPQTTIADFLTRNARLIIGVGLFVTFWMLVYTFTLYKPQFAAKSTVIIKDSAVTSRYIEPDQYYALQTTSSSSSNPVLNTMGILKSGAISDALWNYFQTRHPEQLEKNKIKTQKDWDRFYQDGSAFIKAKNQPGTDLIAIQFSWSDPVIAKEALTVVVSAFQDASRDLNREEQVSRTKFLNSQVGEIEKQLADIRQQKSMFQSDQHTVSIQREGDDLAGSRMELGNKLNQLESQARGKEDMVHRYQQLLGMTPEIALKASALGQNGSMSRLQDELYHLQQQYALLNSSLTETNPKVREVQAQIDQVKASIDAEQIRTLGKLLPPDNNGVVADNTRNTLITNMLQAQGEERDLRTQANVVQERVNQINRDIRNFPETAEGLANLEQKETSLSTALDQLRQKVLEGKLKEEQTLSNVFIVDAPRLPDKAQFPTRSHLIVLSLLLGAGVGLASAFAKEQFVLGNPMNMPDWLTPIDDDHDDNHHYPGNGRHQETSLFVKPANPTPTASKPIQNLPPVRRPIVPGWIERPSPAPAQDPSLNYSQPESRHDLPRPLNSAQQSAQQQAKQTPRATQPATIPQQPVPSNDRTVHSNNLLKDADLLPPMLEPAQAEPVQPSTSVKVATPMDTDTTAALLQRLHRPSQSSSLHSDLVGIPIMHAAPQPTIPQPEPAAAEQQLAKALYESQAKSMPLPRRQRSLPAFLLEEASQDNDSTPYTLIPKKQLLSEGDNLMQDVAPLDTPVDSNLTRKSPIPAFMQPDKPKAPRKPLLGNLLFRTKTVRHPELHFGINSRSQKELELPSSLSRIMQNQMIQTGELSPATMDS
jgi:uncharacterized protein involved in exopolysaccharide biosynthesis